MIKNKKQNPVRYRAARSDAHLGTIITRIEKDYGLPTGSVWLVLPNKRKARVDGTVGSLLKKWHYH